MEDDLIRRAVLSIRMLAADGVEKANSGHPGTPMALADIALVLWMNHLRYDPKEPNWPDRDRFVLSCGHASMLLYSMLHLSGYAVTMDDLKAFRQWGSNTPGHPELGVTAGVETTTGPLGQGISNAVGMALSLKMLAARAKREGVVTARVFGIASDGDLMEGVSSEASSLAGHLGLDNLVFFYDDNRITIDGDTNLAFSEDVKQRYLSYGFHVTSIDGHDHRAIRAALDEALLVSGKPKLIIARTHIGIGAPNKQDTKSAHGEPLGAAELKLTKQGAGWPLEPSFFVPDDVRAMFARRADAGAQERLNWTKRMEAWKAGDPAAYHQWVVLTEKQLPSNLLDELVKAAPSKEVATRVSAGIIEQRAAALVPSLVGGSADLNPSTKTYIEGSAAISKSEFSGRNIHFGIREHAMGAIVNGMAMTPGFIPFGSTFLVFSDYMRPTIRLAALSHLQSIFVFTHDSVYLGEDGPTHQPVEHFWALRLIPNLHFVRPCDALECAAAWTMALERRNGPTVIALSRQNLPALERPANFDPAMMMKGGYVIADTPNPSVVMVATGSEVSLAVATRALLEQQGQRVRVVSALCLERLADQGEGYLNALLPPGALRVALEIGVSAPWRSVVGDDVLLIGHNAFGASAPAKTLAEKFGFVPQAVAAKVADRLSSRS